MIRKYRQRGNVEFVLDLGAAEVPHLMGSWDGWQFPGTPMVRQRGAAALWKALVKLPPGEHQFRYRIGADWLNDAAADRYVDNGHGGDNSVVVIEEAPKNPRRRASSKRVISKRPNS